MALRMVSLGKLDVMPILNRSQTVGAERLHECGAMTVPRRITISAICFLAIFVNACGSRNSQSETLPPVDELLKRANAGETDALFDLGTRYANGDGVPRDNVLAYMWFGLAAELLTTEERYRAQRMQMRLDTEMFRHQISEAERLAGIWKTQHRQPDG